MTGVTLKGLTREFLEQRQEDVERDPSFIERDPLTLSTIWYRLRPKFIAHGLITLSMEPKKMKDIRRMVEYQYVRDICEGELGVKRAELGIHAAVRAQLYYRGEVFDIRRDNFDELADKGSDIIIIEKEGVAEILAPFADMAGMAILNSRGFFTENADDFSEAALEKLGGSNTAILHDFDVAGVAISKKVPEGIVSLGIDPQLLQDLEIDISTVEESYNGLEGGDWQWLKINYPDYEHLDYLKNKRVEIDSVLGIVGAERLWQAILSRLEEASPTRDYRRALEIKDFKAPPFLDHFTDMAVRLLKRAVASCNEQICQDYSNVEGFINDVEDEEAQIEDRQLAETEKDEIVKKLRGKLKKINQWLKEQVDEG